MREDEASEPHFLLERDWCHFAVLNLRVKVFCNKLIFPGLTGWLLERAGGAAGVITHITTYLSTSVSPPNTPPLEESRHTIQVFKS